MTFTPLTDRYLAILRYIHQFRLANEDSYGPSLRNICDGVHISSKSVASYSIDNLVGRGFLTRGPARVANTVKLTAEGRKAIGEC